MSECACVNGCLLTTAERQRSGTKCRYRDGRVSDVSCAPVLRTKVGSGYTTDDGEQVGSHTLYMVDCACDSARHQGACWYASEDRARQSYGVRSGM